MRRGWFNESYRHKLSRMGIKTRGMSAAAIKHTHDSIMSKKHLAKPKESYLKEEKRYKWKSVYEAPTNEIIKEFKQMYGREPSEAELNDILLEGEW